MKHKLSEALRLANEFKLCIEYDSIPSMNDVAKAEAELRRLHAENQALHKDAARYRWLREGNDAKHGAAWHVAVNLYGCEWDAAIDAARKQGGAT